MSEDTVNHRILGLFCLAKSLDEQDLVHPAVVEALGRYAINNNCGPISTPQAYTTEEEEKLLLFLFP